MFLLDVSFPRCWVQVNGSSSETGAEDAEETAPPFGLSSSVGTGSRAKSRLCAEW